MSDLKIGEPVPTGIPGIEPFGSTELTDAAEAVVKPFEQSIGNMTAAFSDSPLFDQLLLFPMKLNLSMALASTAMLVSPAVMANGLGMSNITR
jgi:hypothetical protein